MLKLNKEEVHFLVTAEMKKEVADFLEAVDAKIAPVLEYIKKIRLNAFALLDVEVPALPEAQQNIWRINIQL